MTDVPDPQPPAPEASEASMTDREKARDLGNQAAALARSIADVLNDALDALEAAEARGRELEEALRENRAILRRYVSQHDSADKSTPRCICSYCNKARALLGSSEGQEPGA